VARVLACGKYDRDTYVAEARELRAQRTREVEELSSLSSEARRARLEPDLRHCLDGDGIYVRRVHAAAKVRADAAASRTQAGGHRLRRAGRRSGRRERRSPGKPLAAGTSGDGDPGPTPAPKSKSEQTVIFVKTRNEKLGAGVWASTVPVHQTCSTSCPFLNNGCYAQRGPGGHVARLEANAKRDDMTALDLAYEEARLIRRAARRVARGTPLRLHVAGDSATAEAAQIVAVACNDWPGLAWSYTHAWREVPRDAWGRVSILASIERHDEAASAINRGYAPALVVTEHPHDGERWQAGGVTWIPCPSQIDETKTCSNCGLCFNAELLLRRGEGIAFAAHGSGAGRVRDALVQLRKKGAVSQ
jgi:hypothetical protein